jgi:DNA repair protein RadC
MEANMSVVGSCCVRAQRGGALFCAEDHRTKTDADGRPLRLGPMIADSRDAARVLSDVLGHEAIEVFGMLCLTAKHHVIYWHEVTRGCLDRTFVHPREVFKPAMMANAAAIVIGHNHPSGDPEPSQDDLDVTTRLMEAGNLLKVAVIDHVIVGDGSFVSLRNVQSAIVLR